MRRWAASVGFAIGVAGVFTACSSGPDHDQDFLAHVSEHGNVSMGDVALVGDKDTTLGGASCTEMRDGKDADYEVQRFANTTKPDGSPMFSVAQSRVIVYYAITDLCPDQMSKRNDAWVNVTSAAA
jgi:Protein of unknown function (DUF732)